ncbi:MAG: hypothetical protein ACREIA_26330 [Opitutaceae bacterium]
MEKLLFSGADWLSVTENNGYGLLPIPHPRDDEIKALILRWIALDVASRQQTAAAIKEDQRFTLLAYSERMASRAVREKNVELVFLGLLALGLDGWRNDWRDNAALLCLHYDAAQKVGAQPDAVFARAAGLLSDKVATALRGFLRRSSEDKSLDAMGYEEGRDDDGFRYRRTW